MPAEHLGFVPGANPRRGRPTNKPGPVLRDQNVLHASCIAFESGFSMSDLLKELNKRVFFWSGWPDRPVRAGRHAMRHYADTDVAIRVPFLDLATSYTPYFSRAIPAPLGSSTASPFVGAQIPFFSQQNVTSPLPTLWK